MGGAPRPAVGASRPPLLSPRVFIIYILHSKKAADMLAIVLAVLFLTLFSSSVIAARSGTVTERSVHKSKVGDDPLQPQDFV